MGWFRFLGHSLIAFSPTLVLFFQQVAPRAQNVILCIGSAFFWLVSMLLPSVLFFAVPAMRAHLAAPLLVAVVVQEVFRFVFLRLFLKTERAFMASEERAQQRDATAVPRRQPPSFAAARSSRLDELNASVVVGVGASLMYLLVMLTPVLYDSLEQGDLQMLHCPQYSLFTVHTIVCLCMSLFQICASIVGLYALRSALTLLELAKYWLPLIGVHVMLSTLSLLNENSACVGALVSLPLVTMATIAATLALVWFKFLKPIELY